MRTRLALLAAISAALGAVGVVGLLSTAEQARQPVAGQRPADASPSPAATPRSPSPEVAPGAENSMRVDPAYPAGEQPRELSADKRGADIVVAAGEPVILRVRSERPVTVQFGDDGPIEVAEPVSPAEHVVALEADEVLTIRVIEPGPVRAIGAVRVNPRA